MSLEAKAAGGAARSLDIKSAAALLRADDARHCMALMAQGSKSFAAASMLLPKRLHTPVAVFYAFCRVADDAIDESQNPQAALSSLAQRLDRVYAGESLDEPVFRALSWLVATYALPRAPFDFLLEGFAWDASNRSYETLEEVHAYAVRVASSVGVVMTLMVGRRQPETLARACDLGVAMQLTNIARDVGEDARRGRLYLPSAWLLEEGIRAEQWLKNPQDSPGLRRVVERLVQAAEPIYAAADQGIGQLPKDVRWAIRAARLIYADIGRVIKNNRFDSLSTRAHTTPWRKLWLAAKAFAARFWRRRFYGRAPLPAAQSLLQAVVQRATPTAKSTVVQA